MRLTSISISSFRGFTNLDIQFGSETTVFIGKNGSGKTNLLDALVKGFSFMFTNDSWNNKMPKPGDTYQRKATFNAFDSNRDRNTGEFNYPIRLACEASLEHGSLQWEINNPSRRGKTKSSLYRDASKRIVQLYNQPGREMPILAYFADSYPHLYKKQSTFANRIISAKERIPPSFGYYDWDSDTNCGEIWRKRYLNCLTQIYELSSVLATVNKAIADLQFPAKDRELPITTERDLAKLIALKKKHEATLNDLGAESGFVESFLKKFTSSFNGRFSEFEEFQVISVQQDKPQGLPMQLAFWFMDGSRVIYELLPQGYKRIFSIVFELAYRNFILNGNTDPAGIVMIDEIDLHLHPELAHEILQRFKLTFPEIQFIVTTHSPDVISSLRKDSGNRVIRLGKVNLSTTIEVLDNYFGADYNTIVETAMQAQTRDALIQNLIESYKTFIKYDLQVEAKKIMLKLSESCGEDNAYIKRQLEER
jgi:predicted ATP-binding protein involved in virulence